MVAEGTGLAATEAIAAGTPVIASAVGPLPRVVSGAGILVESGDRDGLGRALTALWTNDSLHARLQGEARDVRYTALARWAAGQGLSCLATAHHADDQAETVLMRLQRGSGVGGLSGIRATRADGDLLIVRPLLGWTKAELVHLVAAAGIEPVDDPSNHDPRFDRAQDRALLAMNPRLEPHRLARTAAACAEADAALDWAATQLAEDRLTCQGGEWRLDAGALPRELARRLLARTVADIRSEHGIAPPWTGSEDVEGLLTSLEAGSAGTLAGVMTRAGANGIWHLRAAPPRRK